METQGKSARWLGSSEFQPYAGMFSSSRGRGGRSIGLHLTMPTTDNFIKDASFLSGCLKKQIAAQGKSEHNSSVS